MSCCRERRLHATPSRRPSGARPDVPDRLADIVARCLAVSPKDRYQTADVLAADLDLVRLELEFAALRAATPADGTPSLFSARTVSDLAREQAGRRTLLASVLKLAARAWSHVAGSFDADVGGLRRATAQMEDALAQLAEAKRARARLRRRAGGLRDEADEARVASGGAFDGDQFTRAERLVAVEQRFADAAIDYDTAVNDLEDVVREWEVRYRDARAEHERLRDSLMLRDARRMPESLVRPLTRHANSLKLAAVLALMAAAVGAWAYALRPEPAPIVQEGAGPPSRRRTGTVTATGESFRSLTAAAAAGDMARVMQFLDAEARLDFAYGGGQPLHAAAARGHAEIVEALLARGASADARGRR